ncbi:hypothetical protein ACF1D3_32310 [Streptomyces sp. NPDC014728]|uniref:hypothetical protein n=1 Tax=unclassified Streptomyces TaxID=2593676 RepID=UPI0036FA8C25
MWDVQRRLTATLAGHTGIVWSAVISPDGEALATTGNDRQRPATTGNDRTVRLWDLRTQKSFGG